MSLVIALLIFLLFFAIIFGFVYWIVTLLPIPSPFRNIVLALVGVIGLLILLAKFIALAGYGKYGF